MRITKMMALQLFSRSRPAARILACLLLWIAFDVGIASAVTIREVQVHEPYLAIGETIVGSVVLNQSTAGSLTASLNHDLRLRVTIQRRVDASATASEKPGESRQVVFDRPLIPGASEIAFKLDAGNCLLGELRAQVEILSADTKQTLSEAWSEPVKIGIRKRISLAGNWQVTHMEPFAYESQWRPKDWKQPELKTVHLPGALLHDEWFRGWITVARDIQWNASGDEQPRFLRLSGVADSALVKIGGSALPETRPTDDMAVLTHWVEFHSPYKGEANAQTRLLFLDLTPQGPINLALPAALPVAGQAHVEMRIRDTSGMFRPRPTPGILGDLHLELTPPVYVKEISFDTEKPADDRRFKFKIALNNETQKPLHLKLRTVYGRYDGKIAYTGNCPVYASVDQPVDLRPGTNSVEIVRDEKPRFGTCRATFLLLDETGRVVDGDSINFHTVTFEVRNRRDFYLNNERFLVKGQGSSGDAPHKRWQLRVMGGNTFRGPTDPEQINLYQSEGLLTSCGGALLASVEKCTFYNPKDTANITKAVRGFTSVLADCPGVIMWEATNELHGEPEEARIAILEAFHKLDPYHRPVLATKGSGEWEAEANDGRVKGVDVVGCQYLLSKEGVDSIAAAVTEQPIMSTEVNWNDASFGRDNLWQYWLDKGIAGSLLFDYSGGALDQPVPAVPPPDNDPVGMLIKRGNRDLYQDLIAGAIRKTDGSIALRLGNQMPYRLHAITVRLPSIGRLSLPDLAPGEAATIALPHEHSPELQQPLVVRVEYNTHGGLPHVAILTPVVTAMPETAKTGERGGAK